MPNWSSQRGASAVETVALAAAVGVLLTVVGGALPSGAPDVARRIGSVLGDAVEHPSRHRWKVGGERVGELGDGAPLPRTRRALAVPERPRWSRRTESWSAAREIHGVRASISATRCSDCADVRASWSGYAGGMGIAERGRGRSAGDGVGVQATALAYAALERVSSTQRLAIRRQHGGASLTVRESIVAGGEADADGRLHFGRSAREAELHLSAIAGAKARAEASAAVDLAGAAIEANGGVEGWAGAGAEGELTAKYSDGKATFHAKLGAAWGVGGALDAGFTVDLSNVVGTLKREARS